MNPRLPGFLIGVILITGLMSCTSAAQDYYIIAATAGPGGSIIPSGEFWVREDGTQIFAITPDDGYKIGMVYVDGNPVGPVQVYTFYSVAADHTISATFVRLTGSISVESQPPGAAVYIDGSYAGRTRAQGPLIIENVPTGMRSIELRLEGYEFWKQQVQVRPGETTVISLIMLIPVPTPTTTVPTTSPTTSPITTVPTTSPTTSPTTTVPTTSPTTSPTTTVPTTSPTTSPTTTVPTTSPTTSPTTTVPTTSPTTSPTTTVPTTTATTKPTATVTTKPTATVTTKPTATATTIPATTVTTTTTPFTTATTLPTTTTTTMVTTTPTMVVTTTPTSVPVTTTTTGPSPFFTTPATTQVVTTIPFTTSPAGDGNTTGPALPPWIRGMSGIPALMLMGGVCVGLVMIDLFSRTVPDSSISRSRRGILFLAYLVLIGALVGALTLFSRGLTPAQEVSPFTTILIPVCAYLLISGLALLAGTLLSHPLRWTLGGHILISLIAAFTAALALIGSSSDLRIPILITFACAVIGGFAARWEYTSFSFNGRGWTGPAPEPFTDTGPHTTVIPSRISPTIPSTFPAELLEKYANPELIGVGGIARVFRAENTMSDESVALKIPVQFNEIAGKCFMKEIKAWEDLNHENIVNIHEVNILPVPYVEMEYIAQSLADLKKPLPPGEAARIVRGIAEGLAYAHSQGIIHRDIKPQNILLTETGIPKITDWGMSKVMGACLPHTITGFSLSYAAPEQIAPDTFGDTDQRTDIYQLGVVFYELLTGKLPFAGEDISLVTRRIISEEAPLPSDNVPGTYLLDAIVKRCLEKDKEKRIQGADDLIAAIDQYVSGQIETGRYEVFED